MLSGARVNNCDPDWQIHAERPRGCGVEIRDVGFLDLESRTPRKAHTRKTGEPVFVGAKRVVHFKAGKEMQKRVEHSARLEKIKMAE